MNATLAIPLPETGTGSFHEPYALPLPDAPAISEPPVSMVMVYADEMANELASHLCTNITRQLKNEVGFRISWWSFDHLQNCQMRQLAVAAALEADVILIATQEKDALPSEVRSWIELWAGEKRNGAGALGIVTVENDVEITDNGLLTQYLGSVAEAAHMDFFSQTFHRSSAVPRPNEFFSDGREHRKWGLNE